MIRSEKVAFSILFTPFAETPYWSGFNEEAETVELLDFNSLNSPDLGLEPNQIVIIDDSVDELDRMIKNPTSADTSSGSAGLTGTPGYMAPEITRGTEASASSDVFALGLITYEMLTGKAAIKGNNILEVIRAIEADELAEEVPQPFSEVVRRSLTGSVEARTVSMSDIANLVTANA